MIALLTYLLVNEYVYDTFQHPDSVFWAIFYFSNHYIALGLISIKGIRTSRRYWKPLYIAISLGFFLKAILELSQIGKTYNEYIISVNTIYSHIIFSFVVLVLIITQYARKKAHNK